MFFAILYSVSLKSSLQLNYILYDYPELLFAELCKKGFNLLAFTLTDILTLVLFLRLILCLLALSTNSQKCNPSRKHTSFLIYLYNLAVQTLYYNEIHHFTRMFHSAVSLYGPFTQILYYHNFQIHLYFHLYVFYHFFHSCRFTGPYNDSSPHVK